MIEYPFAVRSVLTRVLEVGDADDHVVFVHGLGARADRWRRNVGTFAEFGYHCHAIDLPGHGFADKGGAFPYTVSGYADFLLGFLDAAGIDRTVLVGTSLGGHVSAMVACREPSRVRALVLVGTLGLVPIGREAAHAIRQSVRNTSRQAIFEKLKFVIADRDQITPEWCEEEYRVNNSPGAEESFALLGDYIAEHVDDDVIVEDLAAKTAEMPILLVWGVDDKAVPLSVGEQAQVLLGNVPLLKITGAGHAPYFERSPEFNAGVLEFLAGVLGPQSKP